LGGWRNGDTLDQELIYKIDRAIPDKFSLLKESMSLAFSIACGLPVEAQHAEKIEHKLLKKDTSDTAIMQIKHIVSQFKKDQTLTRHDCSCFLAEMLQMEQFDFKESNQGANLVASSNGQQSTEIGDTHRMMFESPRTPIPSELEREATMPSPISNAETESNTSI